MRDLHERRVDTWVRDFTGATHVLDVYRLQRVDKCKVRARPWARGWGGGGVRGAPVLRACALALAHARCPTRLPSLLTPSACAQQMQVFKSNYAKLDTQPLPDFSPSLVAQQSTLPPALPAVGPPLPWASAGPEAAAAAAAAAAMASSSAGMMPGMVTELMGLGLTHHPHLAYQQHHAPTVTTLQQWLHQPPPSASLSAGPTRPVAPIARRAVAQHPPSLHPARWAVEANAGVDAAAALAAAEAAEAYAAACAVAQASQQVPAPCAQDAVIADAPVSADGAAAAPAAEQGTV